MCWFCIIFVARSDNSSRIHEAPRDSEDAIGGFESEHLVIQRGWNDGQWKFDYLVSTVPTNGQASLHAKTPVATCTNMVNFNPSMDKQLHPL